MEQGSEHFEEEEIEEMMNITEVARAIEYLRALGLTDTQINDFFQYIATGVGLPINDENPASK